MLVLQTVTEAEVQGESVSNNNYNGCSFAVFFITGFILEKLHVKNKLKYFKAKCE